MAGIHYIHHLWHPSLTMSSLESINGALITDSEARKLLSVGSQVATNFMSFHIVDMKIYIYVVAMDSFLSQSHTSD